MGVIYLGNCSMEFSEQQILLFKTLSSTGYVSDSADLDPAVRWWSPQRVYKNHEKK